MTQGWQTYGRSTHDKRKKRVKSKKAANSSAATTPANAPGPEVVARPQASTSRPAAATSNVSWRSAPVQRSAAAAIRAEDYKYVYSDLKRIAVLATGILATLVILTFIIK